MTEARALGDAAVSQREAEVLALLGEHLTNAEIAARLYISVRTVETHVSSLLRKLGANDRRALGELAASRRPPDEAPPAPARPTLPVPLTSFIGRVAERAALAEALGGHRLVTAVGPGGVGKTRLALSVAADLDGTHADGAAYVDLVPVTDPAMVGDAVAAALGFEEQPGRSPSETVTTRLAAADALVVLDNCEHLADGVAAFVERLLSACPSVVVLATSRVRLVVPFEYVFPVPGMSLTHPGDEGDGGDAAALFLDRAALAGWSPQMGDDRRRIATICERLDGSALAIELAAARVAGLGLDGLESGLANQMGLLAGGSRLDERHRSLRSALDWSYALLDPVDQAVLRRASHLAAPFTPDAAANVVVDPPVGPGDVPQALARLADHSLLVVTPGPDGTRYRLLETVSQYGGELLDEVGEHDAVHARHLAWCESIAAALETGEGARAPAFEAVVDDLRAALTWASGEPDRRAAAHELALRLARLTFSHRLLRESQRRYEQAAALAGNDADAAEALHLAAGAAAAGLWGNETVRLYRAAADAARRAGDRRRAALDLARTVECAHRFPGIMHELLSQEELATLLAEARVLAGGDPHVEAAILTATATAPNIGDRDPLNAELAERAVELARRVDDARLESGALDQLEVSQLAVGDVLGAAAGAQRRVALLSPRWRDVDVAFELSDALHMAAMTSIGVGDLAAGRDFARQRLDLPFHGEERHMAVDWLLVVAALAGDLDEAVELTRRFRAGWERAGRPPWGGFAVTPAAAAMVFGLRGDDQAREEWLGILAEMRRVVAPVMERIPRFGPTFEALVALHRGELDAASAALAEDPGSVPHWHTGVWNQWYSALWAETTVLAERPDRYDRLARARMITARNPIAAAVVDRAEALAAGDRAGLVASAAAFEAAGCRYQRARTLVLAGGDERVEGEAALAALGAAPMALQADWLTRRIRRA